MPKKKEKVEVEQTAKFTQTTEPIEPTDETPTKKVVEKTKVNNGNRKKQTRYLANVSTMEIFWKMFIWRSMYLLPWNTW